MTTTSELIPSRHLPRSPGAWRREQLGYAIWGSLGLLVLGPDVLAVGGVSLPWSTLSQTIGHLSGPWKVVVAFLILSFGTGDESHEIKEGKSRHSAPLGLVASGIYLALAASLTAVASLLIANAGHNRFQIGYTLYGGLATAFVVTPAILAYVAGRDVAYPTFDYTIRCLHRRVPLLATAIYNVTRVARLK